MAVYGDQVEFLWQPKVGDVNKAPLARLGTQVAVAPLDGSGHGLVDAETGAIAREAVRRPRSQERRFRRRLLRRFVVDLAGQSCALLYLDFYTVVDSIEVELPRGPHGGGRTGRGGGPFRRRRTWLPTERRHRRLAHLCGGGSAVDASCWAAWCWISSALTPWWHFVLPMARPR